ncbi:MAG: hypothetical protein O3B31_14900, partial [Chloroflexi bacterium]|nr:hypothetical protein [Chloroflexota bacterium]
MTSVRGLARVKYVKVAVNSGRPTFMTFSYAIPPGRDVARGDVVHVPFGQRTLQGVVVDGPVDMPGYDPDAVRPLEPPVADAPRIMPERVRLAAWVRDYYLAPPWEAHALFLPPGAGERPRSALVRAAVVGEPAALSAHQAAIFDALDAEEPRDIDELKRDLRASVPARNFDAAVTALVRRQLAERRYALGRPRGRARVAEVARL